MCISGVVTLPKLCNNPEYIPSVEGITFADHCQIYDIVTWGLRAQCEEFVSHYANQINSPSAILGWRLHEPRGHRPSGAGLNLTREFAYAFRVDQADLTAAFTLIDSDPGLDGLSLWYIYRHYDLSANEYSAFLMMMQKYSLQWG